MSGSRTFPGRSALVWAPLCLALVAAPVAAGAQQEADARRAPAASITVPAYAFDRGNLLAIASGSYADAEPVVVNGGEVPNFAEYDIDFPVSATFTLHVRYAAQESRPVGVSLDGVQVARGLRPVTGSWQSSSARWEEVCDLAIARGKHTLGLRCPGPCIPHIVALRFDSPEPFPPGWRLQRPGARKLDEGPLGQLAGHASDRDGFEAFVREDGSVDVPDEYNPIIRFARHPPPVPPAHRLLEYTLMGAGRYEVRAEIVETSSDGAEGWGARLSVAAGDRTESAFLPLSREGLEKSLRHTRWLIADYRASGEPALLESERRQAEEIEGAVASLLAARIDKKTRWERFYELYLEAFKLENRVALANPLLDLEGLVFVKRQTYDTSHIYTTYFDGSNRFGGNLYVLDDLRPDAEPRRLVAELGDSGIYRDPDVSWDGKRVLFSHRARPGEGYHIWEVGTDGTGLRQLTSGDYDDVDPVFLPSGRIMFVSTRGQRVVLCHNAFTVSVLHTMEADGSDIRCVSANTVNEFTPSVAADGSVLYTRWEYVDKNVGNNQSLWQVRPDGSLARHIAGAHWGPITFWGPRQVPGSHLIACTLAPHMPIAAGPIALVDPRDVCRSPARYINLTPELPPPHHFSWHRADVGYSCDPYPLAEKYFIVSYSYAADPRDPRGYGLYVLDRSGRRHLLYRDPGISCFEAMPIGPRPRPLVVPESRREEKGAGGEDAATGTLLLLDVYRGLEGIERGAVKYLRVIEEVPKRVSAQCAGYRLQHPLISRDGNFAVKRLLGTVPVEEDGSAHFEAPAGKAIYFSALDRDFMEIQRMRSFIHLEPGQTVSCVGCHEDRRSAPPNLKSIASSRPPSAITPPPGGARALDFRRDVQPVLDRYCASCHSGDRVEGAIDLSGDATNLFNVAFETLTSGWVSYVDIYSSATLALRPPRFYGSHASKLIEVLRGAHRQHLELPPEALRAIATWIDLNAPYYGTYRYTRPGTVGGRELVSGKVERSLEAVFTRRCAPCHGGDTGRLKRVRVPGIERSPVLAAPLAVADGGSGRCGQAVFTGRGDPDYLAMLEALRELAREVERNPRADQLAERPPIHDPGAPYRYR